LAAQSARVATPSPSPALRVLVVDDDDEVVELVRLGLEFNGFDVESASTGRQAVERALELRPDIVLLDVELPDLDGFEVVRRLRGLGVRSPVVFVTSRDRPEDAVHGFSVGADDYVAKPFAFDELLARVQAILRRTGTTRSGR
jgi:two-component system OmpR family response regulator